MLSNRFGRLLANILFGCTALCVGLFVLTPFCKETDAVVATIGSAFAVGLVHQICWDLLDAKFLNNVFVLFIKRLLFIAVAVFAAALTFSSYNSAIADQTWEQQNLLAKALTSSSGYAFIFSVTIACASASKGKNKKKGPFLFLITVLFSVVFGFVGCLFGSWALKVLPIIVTALGILYCLTSMNKNGWIYKPQKTNDSASESQNDAPNIELEPKDYREPVGLFLNEFKLTMMHLSNAASESVSVTPGAELDIRVDESVRSNTLVSFKIESVLRINESYPQNAQNVLSERDEKIKEAGENLLERAEEEIETFRQKYKGYDREIKVVIEQGEHKVEII